MSTLALPAPAPTTGVSPLRTEDLRATTDETPRVFKAVILYEDVPTALGAARAARQLATGLSPGARVTQSLWRFNLMDQPQVQFKVMAEAAQADAVIVSSHSPELPAGVSAWIDAALADHIALILVLLSGSDEGWTITIRHAPGFSGTPSHLPAGAEKTFRCGTQPALLLQTA